MTPLQSFTILLFTTLIACNWADKKTSNGSNLDSTEIEQLPKSGELYKYTSQKAGKEEEYDVADSIKMVRTLELALKMADIHKDDEAFTLESDTLNIRYGHFFSSSTKHLIVTRIFQYGVNVDIYKLQNKTFVKVCSKDMAPFAYIGDTIQDVNGDGRSDYLFHWYPESGCCLRDIFDVYLQKPNGDFADEVEFINPNFSANEKIIRGQCYGYGAPLYKYKWNGYHVDTIEYIYFPDNTNGNRFIRRKHEDETEKGIVIKQLPNEYKKVGYE